MKYLIKLNNFIKLKESKYVWKFFCKEIEPKVMAS